MLTNLQRAALLAAFVVTGTGTGALAQETATDPHHPEATTTETTTPAAPEEAAQQGEGGQPNQTGMMAPGMMGPEMMERMMGGMRQSGGTDAMPMMRMHGHMMKIVFAIADADGDGVLSFEEIAAIQKRIFDAVDADQGGTVTPEELQGFMWE